MRFIGGVGKAQSEANDQKEHAKYFIKKNLIQMNITESFRMI